MISNEIVVSRLEETTSTLVKTLESIDSKNCQLPMRNDWSATPHEVMRHMIGWNVECKKAATDFLEGKRPEYEGREDSKYNNKFFDEYKDFEWEELQNLFIQTRIQLIDFIKRSDVSQIEEANSRGWIWEMAYEDNGSYDTWDDEYKVENLKMEFHTIVDLSYHDKDHINDFVTFLKEIPTK